MFNSAPATRKVTILWIAAGLGCDGESVALTAAFDRRSRALGGLPGIPEVRFINPFYSDENANEYIECLENAKTLETRHSPMFGSM